MKNPTKNRLLFLMLRATISTSIKRGNTEHSYEKKITRGFIIRLYGGVRLWRLRFPYA
jgi:hypothetical protein